MRDAGEDLAEALFISEEMRDAGWELVEAHFISMQ